MRASLERAVTDPRKKYQINVSVSKELYQAVEFLRSQMKVKKLSEAARILLVRAVEQELKERGVDLEERTDLPLII
jgi:Zn-dependent oligopeptidase